MRCAALLLLLVALPLRADPLDDLKKKHSDAQKAYFEAVEKLPDTPAGHEELDRLWKAFDREQGSHFEAAVRLAMADPKSDAGCDALIWVLSIPRAYYLDAGLPAFDLASTFHAANPRIGPAAAMVGRHLPVDTFHPARHAAAVKFIEAVAARNTDHTARGQAKSGLAYQAYRRFAYAEYQRSKDTDRLAAEVEAAYETLARDHSTCRDLRSKTRTIGEEAHAALHELRNLRVGKVAPDITHVDLDGKRFKLSDSRGKVTLLVFWGHWCGPCMALMPQERALAERYSGKPFTIVGVNCDEDRANARDVATREKMTWRSFWEGDERRISREWNIHGYPETYLLDAAGVIRFRGVVRDDLDKAVADLMAELEKK